MRIRVGTKTAPDSPSGTVLSTLGYCYHVVGVLLPFEELLYSSCQIYNIHMYVIHILYVYVIHIIYMLYNTYYIYIYIYAICKNSDTIYKE